MNNVSSIVTYLVNEENECADCAIYNDIERAKEIYNRIMGIFSYIVKIGYMLDETGLKCRLDAANIFNLLRVKGAFS